MMSEEEESESVETLGEGFFLLFFLYLDNRSSLVDFVPCLMTSFFLAYINRNDIDNILTKILNYEKKKIDLSLLISKDVKIK